MNQCDVCSAFIMDTCCTLAITKKHSICISLSCIMHKCASFSMKPVSSSSLHQMWGFHANSKDHLVFQMPSFNVTFKHGELVMVCCQVKLWHFQGVEVITLMLGKRKTVICGVWLSLVVSIGISIMGHQQTISTPWTVGFGQDDNHKFRNLFCECLHLFGQELSHFNGNGFFLVPLQSLVPYPFTASLS